MTQTYNTYFSDNVSIKQTTPVSQTTHQDRNTYLPDHKSMKTQRTYLPRNRVGIKTQTPVFQTTKNEDTDNTCLAQDYVRRQTRLISESKHKDTCKPLFPRRSSMKTQKTTTNLATNNNYLARRRSMNQTQLTWGLFLNRRSCSHELHVFVSMHKALCIITYICGVMCHTSTLPPVTWYQTLLKRKKERKKEEEEEERSHTNSTVSQEAIRSGRYPKCFVCTQVSDSGTQTLDYCILLPSSAVH